MICATFGSIPVGDSGMRLILAAAIAALASGALADDRCDPLKPDSAANVTDSFKGKVEGDIKGVVSKFVGASADIAGEFEHLQEDTLKDYPDANKLYVWQRIIYLACVDSNVDVNHLFELYLNGPPSLEKHSQIQRIKIGDDVEFVKSVLGQPTRHENLGSSSDSQVLFF